MESRFHLALPWSFLCCLALGSAPSIAATVGAYYYPWWGESIGGHTFSQTLRDHLPAENQLPLIGEYNNRDLWTIASHIDQSQAANVSMWSLSWWGPTSFENRTIRDHILSHPHASRLNYTIHYESTGRLGSFSSPDYSTLIPDFRHLAENVFTDPNYMRIDGRPVVVMYLSRVYFDDPAGWSALSNLRATMQTEYGFDPYIIGDHFFNTMAAGASHLDAVTAFDTYGQTFRNGVTPSRVALLAHRYATANIDANNAGADFVPGISPGYNDRGVRLPANNPAAQRYFDGEAPTTAGSVFNGVIQSAALPNVDPDTNELILINSFNEWHEDTQIEAAAVSGFTNADDSASGSDYTQGKFYEGYGTKYLDILRTTTGGPAEYAIYNGVFGDVNQDGTLNLQDANAFRSVWSTTSAPDLPLRDIAAHGDWNLDGTTDLSDALQLRSALLGAGFDVPLEQLVPSLLANGGFESPDLDVTNGGNPITSGWDSVPDVPAWNSDGTSVNSGIQPDGPAPAGTLEGTQTAYLGDGDPSGYQTTNLTIRMGDEFTLQFGGARYSNNATLEASIYYSDGSARTVMETITLTESDPTDPLSRQDWNVYTLTASVDDHPAAIGHAVGVEFASQRGLPALDGAVLWLSASGMSGDFDGNGQYDCQDIDALVAEIAAGTNASSFDLTRDGFVDHDDLSSWLAEAGAANLTSGNAYLAGDANLDGAVDGSDFGLWNANKFTGVPAWCSGDVNADGTIDGSDFGIWNANKFTSSNGVVAVPEPVNIAMILLAGWLWAASRRRR